MSIEQDIHNKLPDNTTKAITPKVMREAFDLLLPNEIAHMTDLGGIGGLFQFDYKVKMAATTTPPAKFIGFDDVTWANTKTLYINKKDRLNADMSLFIADIKKGDYFNIHDNNNVNQFVAFDVTGDAVLNGNVFEVPVSRFADHGTLTDGERVYIHWKQEGEMADLMHDIGDIHTFVAGKDLAIKLMELKKQVDKNSHTSGTANAPKVFDAQVNVDGAAGGFIMADFVNTIANPANPGKDILDGAKHYVQFLEHNHPVPVATTWIWLTQPKAGGGTETKRLWTNDAKTKAVGGIEMETWIRLGAMIEIQYDTATSEWFVRDVNIPAAIPAVASKALVTKGVVTNVADITEMGIYEGTDITGAPITGHVIIEAYEDKNGDLDLSLKDSTNRRYEGGKPSGGTAMWAHVAPDHLFGTADPANSLGHDGDIYFKLT